MLGISTPKAVTKTITHLEWKIETPCNAKEFNWALGLIEGQMRSTGIDMSFDDCYRVKVVEDGIIFRVKLKENR